MNATMTTPAPGPAPRPLYPHDCTECRYLGTVRHTGRWYDLYKCPGPRVRGRELGEPELTARYSAAGPDYSAAPLWLVSRAPAQHGVLGVAYELTASATRAE